MTGDLAEQFEVVRAQVHGLEEVVQRAFPADAAIAGGMSGITTFLIFDVGLLATPAPGSIFALMAVAPRGDHLGVLAGVAVGTIVSFVVASMLLGFGRAERRAEREAAQAAQASGKTGADKGE